MAASMFRVVWTGSAGLSSATEPLPRDEAMREFDSLHWHRAAASQGRGHLRVIREQDYQPALFGPQNQVGVYRGSAD